MENQIIQQKAVRDMLRVQQLTVERVRVAELQEMVCDTLHNQHIQQKWFVHVGWATCVVWRVGWPSNLCKEWLAMHWVCHSCDAFQLLRVWTNNNLLQSGIVISELCSVCGMCKVFHHHDQHELQPPFHITNMCDDSQPAFVAANSNVIPKWFIHCSLVINLFSH